LGSFILCCFCFAFDVIPFHLSPLFFDIDIEIVSDLSPRGFTLLMWAEEKGRAREARQKRSREYFYFCIPILMKTKFLPDTIAPPTYRAVAPQQL
jgi:hypothetical protein